MSGLKNILRGIATMPVLVLFATGGLLFSCGGPDTQSAAIEQDDNMAVEMNGMTRAAVDNTQVYFFNTSGTFARRIVTSREDESTITMTAPVGTWDVALVASEDGSGMAELIQPVAGVQRAGQKMFELKPRGGVLYSAPELLVADIADQPVLAGVTNEAEATFTRNVARVQFEVKDPRGFDVASTAHTVSIGNIPSTIDWTGRLLPSAANPATSTERMSGSMTFTDLGGGAQKSSTVAFLVPAHRGTSAADTTRCKLNVAVSFRMSDGSTYTSSAPVEIPVVPQANKILTVRLLVDGELTVDSDILAWDDETPVDVEISNPYSGVRVGKPRLDLHPLTENMIVTATSHGVSTTPAVEPHLPWVQYAWGTGANATTLTVTGDPDSYDGTPRNSAIDIAVDNFTKRIPVTQQHTVTGSISALSPVVLSPAHPSRTVAVTTNPTSGQWRVSRAFLDSYTANTAQIANATLSTRLEGTSGQTFTVTRKTFPGGFDNGDYSMFGNTTIKVHNRTTLEVKNIDILNIYMTVDPIGVTVPTGTDARTTYVIDNAESYGGMVEIYGGSQRFTVKAIPTLNVNNPSIWIASAECVANTNPATMAERPWVLKIVVRGEGQDEELQPQTITLVSVDDPAYELPLTIEPTPAALFDPFDYFVFDIAAAGRDIETAIAFYDNNAPFDEIPLGYNMYRAFYQNGSTLQYVSTPSYTPQELANLLLVWGGDSVSGTGETVFFNAPMIDADDSLPRKVRLEIWLYWRRSTDATTPITATFYAYEGGTMTLSGKRFYNYNGTALYSGQRTFTIPYVNGWNSSVAMYKARSTYRLVCTIIYDRRLHSARAYWNGESTPPPFINPHVAQIQLGPVFTNAQNEVDPKQAEIEALEKEKEKELLK